MLVSFCILVNLLNFSWNGRIQCRKVVSHFWWKCICEVHFLIILKFCVSFKIQVFFFKNISIFEVGQDLPGILLETFWNLFYSTIWLHGYITFKKKTFTLPITIPDRKRKLTSIFIFTLVCGASKGFMKALEAFTKPFEAHKELQKQKFTLIFILIQVSEMHGARSVKNKPLILIRIIWTVKRNWSNMIIYTYSKTTIIPTQRQQ